MEQAVRKINKNAYSASQFVAQALEYITSAEDITDLQKSHIACKIGLLEQRLNDSAEETLQLLDLGAFSARVMQQ